VNSDAKQIEVGVHLRNAASLNLMRLYRIGVGSDCDAKSTEQGAIAFLPERIGVRPNVFVRYSV